jgi:hypothetical protein
MSAHSPYGAKAENGSEITVNSRTTLTVGAVAVIGMSLPNVAFSRALLSGPDETKTLDCAGGPARIAGANNRVTLKGDCTHRTVLGSRNTITAEFAAGASIWFAGSKNEVAWKTPDGKEPRVHHSGFGNTLRENEVMRR